MLATHSAALSTGYSSQGEYSANATITRIDDAPTVLMSPPNSSVDKQPSNHGPKRAIQERHSYWRQFSLLLQWPKRSDDDMRYVFKAAHFVIVIALAMPVAAQDFEAGLEAYESGDYAAALREIPALAAQDDADAQFNLGLKYARGLGVARDYAEALRWFRMAAEQGHAKAQYNLGLINWQGQSVPRNFVQAHMWWTLSASQGTAFATQFRDNVEGRMTPEQIAKAEKLAREWKPK